MTLKHGPRTTSNSTSNKLLEVQTPGPHPRPTELIVSEQDPQVIRRHIKFEKHWFKGLRKMSTGYSQYIKLRTHDADEATW